MSGRIRAEDGIGQAVGVINKEQRVGWVEAIAETLIWLFRSHSAFNA